MGLSRIAMNNVYLKLCDKESETTHLKNQVTQMIKLAGGQKINMTGSPYIYNSPIRLFGKEYLKETVTVPMILSYQVPYYYALYTNKTIEFVNEPLPGQHYLVIDYDHYKLKGRVVYDYDDAASNHHWYLIRMDDN